MYVCVFVYEVFKEEERGKQSEPDWGVEERNYKYCLLCGKLTIETDI